MHELARLCELELRDGRLRSAAKLRRSVALDERVCRRDSCLAFTRLRRLIVCWAAKFHSGFPLHSGTDGVPIVCSTLTSKRARVVALYDAVKLDLRRSPWRT